MASIVADGVRAASMVVGIHALSPGARHVRARARRARARCAFPRRIDHALIEMARVTRHRAFDILHALPPLPLICHAVWFAGQRPWDAAAAYSSGCAFSLVQSTSGATPSEVARQIAPHLAACPL